MSDLVAIRGAVVSYTDDPFVTDLDTCMVYESDAIITMEDGKISAFGPAGQLKDTLPDDVNIIHYKNSLISAGFIDCHVHYPQTEIIGAHGKQLIDWLTKYAFVAEEKFGDKAYARNAARVFLSECLRNGTTTNSVYCTVHPQSVEAFFEESQRLNMRNIAGKVLMDRNARQGRF